MTTKLEELKAAYDDTWDAYDTWTAWDDYVAAWKARNAAWGAYKAELKKTQEENSDDH